MTKKIKGEILIKVLIWKNPKVLRCQTKVKRYQMKEKKKEILIFQFK